MWRKLWVFVRNVVLGAIGFTFVGALIYAIGWALWGLWNLIPGEDKEFWIFGSALATWVFYLIYSGGQLIYELWEAYQDEDADE